MSESQEKEVPIKIHGIPVAMVKVRRGADGKVSIALPESHSITNFDLIAQLTFDEDQETAVDDPVAKFRNSRNQMGLNGL